MSILPEDHDSLETQEWLLALASVLDKEGIPRAHFLLEKLIDKARRSGAYLPYRATTAYRNTIPAGLEAKIPGDPEMDRRIQSLIRWNAMAMVVKANRFNSELGGHIASFASSATLYEVGFNYFFRAPTSEHPGDLLYIQGHSSPGIYARAFLEGRLTEEHLLGFRQEVSKKNSLTSYPHPWLMPDFWQFPTVSMGLGPIQAIYQARFMKYLSNRGLLDPKDSKVWCFCGDGEMDEPESLGAISLAGREGLDNLIFVINCNLQRLDGPVRGNGKIIQELEGCFRGAGWNAIKVIWGRYWDPLFAKDSEGILLQRMEEAVDGDYQNYKGHGGAYTREHFFGKYPELREMVANMSDDDIWRLNRGGHDAHKVYAAYANAVKHLGQPTVILAKTVKGFGLGSEGEGKNVTHQLKKLAPDTIRHLRDHLKVDISDEQLAQAPFYRPENNSPEIQYLRERRRLLGGYMLQRRRVSSVTLSSPALSSFDAVLKGSENREISTTMALVRLLGVLTKDKTLGQRIVPIIPDEARTFGLEGMFRQLGIYSSVGQKYEPIDAGEIMYYREDQKGQILEEGITEAGAFCSWMAAANSYSTFNYPMIPFYIFYSMFGFQRIGDLAWAAGDMQARGFLIGATSGRTTLAGEGLQHQDGQSQLHAAMIPNCVAYDPTFGYELAVIIQEGLTRMIAHQENIFYYITALNENYVHPAMPAGIEQDILKGIYLFKSSEAKLKVHLMGCGAIFREVMAAAEILQNEFNIGADLWSVTSFNELRREGLEVARWNLLHPEQKPKICTVTKKLQSQKSPVIAATDYMKSYADQIREFVPHRYVVLGTDGFGRSDGREALRRFFEVDRHFIVVAALKALADEKLLPIKTVTDALKKYGIDTEKPIPSRL